MKFPVSQHVLAKKPSTSLEDYEAKRTVNFAMHKTKCSGMQRQTSHGKPYEPASRTNEAMISKKCKR